MTAATTALVSTGVLVTCCGDHLTGGCCDRDDCAPCCPECPTCPVVQARTPTQRRSDAEAHRALLLDLMMWREEIRTPPWAPPRSGEASPWSTTAITLP
jgi:hypothetical protein